MSTLRLQKKRFDWILSLFVCVSNQTTAANNVNEDHKKSRSSPCGLLQPRSYVLCSSRGYLLSMRYHRPSFVRLDSAEAPH